MYCELIPRPLCRMAPAFPETGAPVCLRQGDSRRPAFGLTASSATSELRRGAGVAEQAGLENRSTCKRIEGSNPFLSARFRCNVLFN